MLKVKIYKYIFCLISVLFFSPVRADIGNMPTNKRDDKNIDQQLQTMKEMLPVEIQNGIRWIDIKRKDKQIQYTYIVNVDFTNWDEDKRKEMIAVLQDFGCRQLLPAMCEGSQLVFSSGYDALTTYHDNLGNYLFDCLFSSEICHDFYSQIENGNAL